MLFECRGCGSELMLETDNGRALSQNVVGSLWRIRMRDSLRLITLTLGIGEMGVFGCVGSGEREARKRLNGDRGLYATGGCVA